MVLGAMSSRWTGPRLRLREAAVACGRGAVRVELGPGQVPGAVRGRAEVASSAAELHKLWNVEKKADPGLAWWPENSKCAYQEAFRDLDRALRDFVKSKKGERKGKRLGFPRFKKRGKCRDSLFRAGAIHCAATAPGFPASADPHARARSSWPARSKTERRGSCRPRCRGRLSGGSSLFIVELTGGAGAPAARPDTAIGVDLGVTTLLTGVDDRGRLIEVAGPKSLLASSRK